MIRLALLPPLVVAAAAATVPWAPPAAIPAPAMADAAARWLDALPGDQRAKATFAFDDEERRAWHFVPNEYPGLALRDMALEPRRRAHDLLRSALSTGGYLKATTIMLLERVLHDMAEQRGRKAAHRDPERYWFAVFGSPTVDKPWGWRVQGHHLSLNFSVVGGKVLAFSPAFMGANPAEVREGPHAGLRALGAEEDLARDLLGLLDDQQRARVLIEDKAPSDVILAPGRDQELLGEPRGLPASDMTEIQRALLLELVGEYAHNLRAGIARTELARIRKAGHGNVYFAWAGSREPNKPHYYRVHGPTFVIEYDNTQNEANHVHTVWRDLENDFGIDWLRQHYRKHR